MPLNNEQQAQALNEQRELHNAQLETWNSLREHVHNEFAFSRRLQSMFLDKRRDIDKECGYPITEEMTVETFRKLYDREPIAAKVVDIYPNYSWQVQPEVYEDSDVNTKTEFELAWDSLLRGSGFYEDEEEESHPVWEYLERADKLSGIGQYGVILLGFDDGKPLSEPVDVVEEGKGEGTLNLNYLRAMDEDMAKIVSIENDEKNPRCGLPTMYSIELDEPNANTVLARTTSTRSVQVHWTRVIHLADNLECSEVYGVSRMQKVYNRLYDLYKLYGGSAEMYWLAAFYGISFETHPQLGGEVDVDTEGMKNAVENMMNSLQRYIAIPGMTAKTLAPTVVDPSKQIDTQLETICIHLEIPKRILMGSERGELASSQDQRNWYPKVRRRQVRYLTPRVIVPFIDRLIKVGVLPKPEKYTVKWPVIDMLTEQEKIDVALKRVDALVKFLQGDGENAMTLIDFYTEVLDYPVEQAENFIQHLEEAEAEDGDTAGKESPLLGLVGGITGMAEIFQKRAEGVITDETLTQLIMLFYGVTEEEAQRIVADSPEAMLPTPGQLPMVPEGEEQEPEDAEGENPFEETEEQPAEEEV